MTIYGATKAFVLFLSQGCGTGRQGRLRAAVPLPPATEIWSRSGVDINTLPVMEVGELVDAALCGL
jgi:short-subunit dehydrogenase